MAEISRNERNTKRYEAYAQYRDRLGYTDYYISKECSIPTSTLSDWKHGRSCPKADTLLRICRLIEVPLECVLVDI